MTCQTCANWLPKQSGQMARYGMAVCKHGPRYVYLPPHHKCGKHHPVAEDVAAARVVWLAPKK
jgi:hypothetical protein